MSELGKKLGLWGELVATDFLVARGFDIVKHNFHCQSGEADIIAYKDHEYWFIEVKTRKNLAAGEPEEAVDDQKISRMNQAALYYLSAENVTKDSWQLAAISILRIEKGKVRIRFLVV